MLTPYSGTNLGDAAIQESAIRGIRGSVPDVVLSGITLNPSLTAELHGIPAVSITGLTIPNYSTYVPPGGVPVRERAGAPGAHPPISRTRQMLKTLPLAGPALRRGVVMLRKLWSTRHEISHVVSSYRVARAHDLIVVAGGGQIDDEWGGPWGHPYALAKWGLLARLTGSRFVVMSVGVCALRHRLSRWFVSIALRAAAYRSYRDDGSKALLRRFAFTRTDPVVPDLAFGLAPSAGSDAATDVGASRAVGVSPIAFGREGDWPTGHAGISARYVAELRTFIEWLGASGRTVVLFASSGLDRLIIAELERDLGARSWLRVAKDETLGALSQELSRMEFVVASRLHGVILAHCHIKPVVAVSFDRKVDVHMAEFHQERFRLDIHSVRSADLIRAFEGLVQDAPAIRSELRERTAAYRAAVQRQYDLVPDWFDGGRR